MGAAIARHYELLDEAVARAGGVRPVEQGNGDSVVAVFTPRRSAPPEPSGLGDKPNTSHLRTPHDPVSQHSPPP